MKASRLVSNLVLILAFGIVGLVLAKSNTAGEILLNEQKAKLVADSIKMVSVKPIVDTFKFKMPKYDERAMQMQQQQMMLEQMSPAQRAQYMQQYQEYMQQMAMQEEMIRQQQEYERQIRANGGIPPVSNKTQSKIEKLKAEFEKKRIQDSIANAKKLPNTGSF